ncbi:MAG: hypothetical protein ACLFVG_10030 [Candidatus Aminicenantes bacterium]
MDLRETISINAVFMPKSFRVLGVSEKSPRKKFSSLEEAGISGDQGFKASGRTKLAVFPPKKLTYKTAHFLLNGTFPAALL